MAKTGRNDDEDIFCNILQEATLNIKALRDLPDIHHKLRDLARWENLTFLRDDKCYKVKGPKKEMEDAYQFLNREYVTVRGEGDTQALMGLLAGERWGRPMGAAQYKDTKLPLPFAYFCAFVMRHKKPLFEEIEKTQCEFYVSKFNKEFVDVMIRGEAKGVDELTQVLQKKFFKFHENALDVYKKESIRADAYGFLEEIKLLNPTVAIWQGSNIHLVFPKGKMDKDLNERVSNIAGLHSTISTRIEDVLREITSGNVTLPPDEFGQSQVLSSQRSREDWSSMESSEPSSPTRKGKGPNSTTDSRSNSSKGQVTHLGGQASGHSTSSYGGQQRETRGSTTSHHKGAQGGQHMSFLDYQGASGQQIAMHQQHRRPKKGGGLAPSPPPKAQFYHPATKIKITCIVADITRLQVDCIVNAANQDLQHIGGVALAIAKAAGPELEKECRKFISKNQFLGIAEVFVSSPGKLSCKKVLHTVGPMWRRHTDQEKCIDQLQETFSNCLNEANKRKMTSIAFPAISSGIYGVPLHHVAHAACDAVTLFCACHSETRPNIKEIYFADIAEDTFDSFGSVFRALVAQGVFMSASTTV